MVVPAGSGYFPAAVANGRPDLDHILRELPPKERRQLGGHRERLALQQVAMAAGGERLWGVVSCRADTGVGVLALTDGRLLISMVNKQNQMWHLPLAIGDVAAVEYEPGGIGQAGCVASLAYGDNGILGFTVGRDTSYATRFLKMAADRVDGVAVPYQPGTPATAPGMSPTAPGQVPSQPGQPSQPMPYIAGPTPGQGWDSGISATTIPAPMSVSGQGLVPIPAPVSHPGLAPNPGSVLPGPAVPMPGPGPVVGPFPGPGPVVGLGPGYGSPAMPAPAMGQPVVGQPAIGQPAIGQPVVGQPAIGQPVVGQPVGGGSLAAIIRDGLEGVCPGQWLDWRPNAAYSIVVGQVGMLVSYDEARLRVTVHAIAGLTYTPELVADLAEVNRQAPLGAFWPRRTDDGTWHVVYGYALFARWLRMASGGSALLLPDLLRHLPGIVDWGAENLRGKHGGDRPAPRPDSGWQETTDGLA